MKVRSTGRPFLSVVCLAFVVATGAEGFSDSKVIYLETGLSSDERRQFFRDGLGNRSLPETWFRALEDPSGRTLLADRDNMRSVGFLYEDGNDLPIGLARNAGPGGAWLGVNCAHCHTTDLYFKGQTVRIVGGTSRFNTNDFYSKVFGAIVRTSRDDVVFDAFAGRLLGKGGNVDLRTQLRAAINGAAAKVRPFVESFASLHPIQSGPRFAFNDIFMNVGASSLDARNVRPERGYAGMRSIWSTGRLEWLHFDSQFKSSVARIALGFSVFDAFFSPTDLTTLNWDVENVTQSVVKVANKLRPPLWPVPVFGKIDSTRADRGNAVYRVLCRGCHEPKPAASGSGFLVANTFPYKQIGTDPLYIESQYEKNPKTGELTPRQIYTGPLASTLFADKSGRPRELVDFATEYLPKMSQAILEARYRAVGVDQRDARVSIEGGRENMNRLTKSYTAKPLDGIWATAPYLHNDSVPNLYELLLPAGQRSIRFRIGGDFDPTRVGYHADAKVGFSFDTTVEGNANSGHEGSKFGTRLDHDARLDLIEYLKTL